MKYQYALLNGDGSDTIIPVEDLPVFMDNMEEVRKLQDEDGKYYGAFVTLDSADDPRGNFWISSVSLILSLKDKCHILQINLCYGPIPRI